MMGHWEITNTRNNNIQYITEKMDKPSQFYRLAITINNE